MYHVLKSILSFQVDKIVTIMLNPRQYKIPDWFLNRQKDIQDGKYSQVMFRLIVLRYFYFWSRLMNELIFFSLCHQIWTVN